MRKVHTFDNGIKVYDDHLLDVQRNRYAVHNIHEPEEEEIFLKILDDLRMCEAFYDIGAAVGYYAFLARQKRPEDVLIRAFEPLPSQMQKMQENIALNGFSDSDFCLHGEAISNRNGQAQLLDVSYASMLVEGPLNPNQAHRTVTVPTITLDAFLEQSKETVGLLQIDVQGHEVKVLRGASQSFWKKSIRHVLIGTHGPRIHEDCIQFLTNRGYYIDFEDFETEDQPDGIIHARI